MAKIHFLTILKSIKIRYIVITPFARIFTVFIRSAVLFKIPLQK